VKKDIRCDLKIVSDLSQTLHPTDEKIDFFGRFALIMALGHELMPELTW
jgi:hypothetical protein